MASSSGKPEALVTGGGLRRQPPLREAARGGLPGYCLDNLRTGSLENVAHLLEGSADFEFVDHGVTAYISFPGDLDEVYHLASLRRTES